MDDFMIGWVIGLVISCIIFGVLGAIVGSRREKGVMGFYLGLLLGPIGVIVAFALDGRQSCVKCNSRLNGKPAVCPHCGQEYDWS